MSKGLLTVNVIDFDTSYAVKDAKVAIYYIHRKDNQWELLCDKLKTDISGQVRKIGLYAPQMIYSQEKLPERPYSRYVVEVTKEGYQKETVIVFPCIEAIQTVRIKKQGQTYSFPSRLNIEDHLLFAGYEPKIIESDEKPTFVLSKAVVPEFIVVHDGMPTDSSAPDYWI